MADDAQIFQEIEELKGKLRIRVSDDHQQYALSGEDWRRIFHDISPAQIYSRIANAAAVTDEVKMDILLNSNGGLSLLSILHNCGWEDPKNWIDFQMDASREVTLSYGHFEQGVMGKSVAKGYLRAAGEMFKEIGIDHIHLDAGNIGSYAWVEYGFLPSNNAWKYLKEDIASRVTNENTINFLGESYPIKPEEYAVIRRVLSSLLPQNIVHLTQLNRSIGSLDGHNLTVGKALLMQTQWRGVLPLSDTDPSYERFRAYTAPASSRSHGLEAVASI